MPGRYRKKGPREKNLTQRYLGGDFNEDRIEAGHRFTDRSKHAEQNKIIRTAQMRSEDTGISQDLDALPIGQVVQVYSRYSDVECDGQTYLCVIRKTMTKVAETATVVGDRVRFRATGSISEAGLPEAGIEQNLPPRTHPAAPPKKQTN